MKINTDGVLLGAIAEADEPKSILDIGTGTGVIALMLAQRYPDAVVDAVEIDPDAAKTASGNFAISPFADRLRLFSMGFEEYFGKHHDKKYDLIVSNPPFYVDSLKSPGAKKSLAKHSNNDFFVQLMAHVAAHLSPAGACWLVLPMSLRDLVIEYSEENSLYIQEIIEIRSYPESAPHRMILSLSASEPLFLEGEMIIFDSKDVYSGMYRDLLQPYFLAF
ncbi:MAG TPA: methyltransferase [Mucilaginibacter sp.]|jgi:tRNA1Val (adenine37-N6)-methyltransferase|nr:methyltransferase [Mucilaginibacter sp.]